MKSAFKYYNAQFHIAMQHKFSAAPAAKIERIRWWVLTPPKLKGETVEVSILLAKFCKIGAPKRQKRLTAANLQPSAWCETLLLVPPRTSFAPKK